MILWLQPWLESLWPPFHALQYITLRAGLAAALAFALALVLGRPLIRHLQRRGVRENAGDSDSPEVGRLAVAAGKDRVPTMGGVFWCGSILLSTLLLADPTELLVLLGAVLLVGMGTLGFLDDWVKWTREGGRNGLSRRAKLLLTVGLSVYVAVMLWNMGVRSGRPEISTIYFPVLKDVVAPTETLGTAGMVVFSAFTAFVILAGCHSANITDGMDGLAAGCGLVTTAALTVAVYAVGNVELATYLHLPWIPGAGEVAVLGGAVMGATLGFLWFNCHPAQIFFGDSGSLPLGAILAYFAIVSKQELALPLLAGVFVLEAASSLIQIYAFKLTGRRVFPIAPLHHVWQLRGMPEPKIVVRFWIVAAVSASLGLLLIKIR